MLHPDEAIEPEQALGMYTREAAYAAGVEAETGTLEVGKRADLVVLSADPRSAAGLATAQVDRTVLGGETVFRRAS